MAAAPAACTARRRYDVAALADLLDGQNLKHLVPALNGTTLGALLLRSFDRVALLAHLRALGVEKLQDRQKIANAAAQKMRAISLMTESSPADTSHPVLSLPELIHRYGVHAGAVGLLMKADGSFAHVNEAPKDRYGFVHYSAGLQQPKLDGPIIALVSQLAMLVGRPIYIPMQDEDAFVCEPAQSYMRTAPRLNGEKLSDFRDAFGEDVAVLTTTHSHGVPSAPCVGLMPAFDSWVSDDAGADAWMLRLRSQPLRRDLPYVKRHSKAVWRGSMTGGGASTSLRGRVVEACRNSAWADVAFVGEMHGRGMSQGADSGAIRVQGELSREEQAAYKIILALDGHTWASAWEWALASGSVIVYIGVWSFHGMAELEPWVHFVPCAGAEELEKCVRWVLAHEEEAERMVQSAYELFRAKLTTQEHARKCIARALATLAAGTT